VRVRLHRARQTLARAITPTIWRFDGARCAGVVARVMAEIT